MNSHKRRLYICYELTPIVVSQRIMIEHFLPCLIIMTDGVELKRGDVNCGSHNYDVDALENKTASAFIGETTFWLPSKGF